MEITFNKIKIITPLGDEEYSIDKSCDVIVIISAKGSANFKIKNETENTLVALANISTPFDCTAELNVGLNSCIKLFDPNLNEEFLSCDIEVV
jgi:hypothetical protein